MPIDAYDLNAKFRVDDSEIAKVPAAAATFDAAAVRIKVSTEEIERAQRSLGLRFDESRGVMINAQGRIMASSAVEQAVLTKAAQIHETDAMRFAAAETLRATSRKATGITVESAVNQEIGAMQRHIATLKQAGLEGKSLEDGLKMFGHTAEEIKTHLGGAEKAVQNFTGATILARGAVRAAGVEIGSVLPGSLGRAAQQFAYVGSSAQVVGPIVTAAMSPIGITIIGITAAAVALVAEFTILDAIAFKTAESFGNYGDKIFKAEKETGLTAKTLEGLFIVAGETGKSFDSLTLAVARSEVNIDKGLTAKSGEAYKSLQRLAKDGLDLVTLRTASTDERQIMLAKSLEKVQDSSDKARVAAGLYGRGVFQNAAAIDLWAQSTENAQHKADAFGLALSEDEVRRAHEFEIAMHDLTLGAEGFGIQVGERTAPMVINALNNIGNALGINVGDWKNWGRDIGEILGHVVAITELAASLIKNSLAAAIKTPYSTAKGLLTGAGVGVATGNWGMGFGMGVDMAGQPTRDAGANLRATYDSAQKALDDMMLNSRFGGGGSGGARGNIQFEPSAGKGRSKRGPDEAREELALMREQLRSQETIWKTEKDEYDQLLKTKRISTETYVADLIALEDERFKAMQPIYAKELAEAEAVRGDAIKKARAVLKVKNDIDEEDYKHAKIVADAKSKLEEEHTAVIKIQTEARFAVVQEYHAQERAAVESLGSFKITNAEQTSKLLGAIERADYNSRHAALLDQQKQAKEDIKLRAELQKQIDELDAKYDTSHAARMRANQAAQEQSLATLRQYAAQLSAMNTQVSISLIDAARKTAETAGGSGAISQRQMRAQITLIDAQAENANFAEVKTKVLTEIANLQAQIESITKAAAVDTLIVVDGVVKSTTALATPELAHLRAMVAVMNRQIEADTKIHEANIKAIRLQGMEELNQRMKDLSASLMQTFSTGINEIFTKGWKTAFLDVLSSFAKMLEQMAIQVAQTKLLQGLQNAGGVSGQGGGGWLQKLLGIGLAGLGAGVGAGGLGGGHGGLNPGGMTGGKAFAGGGSFTVGGDGGIDTSWIGFRATKGERVTIETPAQQMRRNGGSPPIINNYHYWTVVANKPSEFMDRTTTRQMQHHVNSVMSGSARLLG